MIKKAGAAVWFVSFYLWLTGSRDKTEQVLQNIISWWGINFRAYYVHKIKLVFAINFPNVCVMFRSWKFWLNWSMVLNNNQIKVTLFNGFEEKKWSWIVCICACEFSMKGQMQIAICPQGWQYLSVQSSYYIYIIYIYKHIYYIYCIHCILYIVYCV